MKRLLFWVFLFSIFPLWGFSAYDPGDLINAVKRSQVITELFMERWAVTENSLSLEELEALPLQERFYYLNRGGYSKHLDVTFHGETVFGYPVSTPFGQYDLDLFRIFGSTIVRFDDLLDAGLFQWGAALSAAGYRYGMKKTVTLHNSGAISDPPTDNFEVSDYLYAQIFDDLIVITNIFKPFGYIHAGLLLNRQVDPGLDGIIDTSDDIEMDSKARIFLNSNLFNFLFINLGYNADSDKTEYAATKIDVMSLLMMPGWVKKRPIWPDFFLGYSYREKTSDSGEHTLFAEMLYNYYSAFYIRGKSELFLWGRGDREKNADFKQNFLEIGFRLDTLQALEDPEKFYGQGLSYINFSYYLIAGLSHLINQRSMDFGNTDSGITGFSFGFKVIMGGGTVGGALEARISYNYSEKLYHLIEAYDHWIGEVSVQIGF